MSTIFLHKQVGDVYTAPSPSRLVLRDMADPAQNLGAKIFNGCRPAWSIQGSYDA